MAKVKKKDMSDRKDVNVDRVGTEHVAAVKPTEIRRKFLKADTVRKPTQEVKKSS